MSKESWHHTEHGRRPVDAYACTFIHRTDIYPIQLGNGSYVTVKKPLTLELIASHLQGKITLGTYALTSDNRAHWVCLDADDQVAWQALIQLSINLLSQAVSSYLEPSRRGGHLWLFTPPLSGREARILAGQLLSQNDIVDIEIYPKQDQLVAGPGSLVRLPLGRHKLTGKRYHFITPEGRPLAPTIREQLSLLSNPRRVPMSFIQDVLASVHPPQSPPLHFPPANTVSGEALSERLKSRITVYEFVSQYVELDSRGRGHCPFHDDEHKSFGINPERNYWHCFAGCGGGSIIDFWAEWREKHHEDPSFTATITELADMLF